ncbi:UNVERIFIED_CONTAM: hypothetical protein PYX00_003000 [Menopon gallinae]|uniref:BTB domain-containing protein n=1 Tax=Menopon gallinae TaxID=328185 RepID=A0AAW2HYH1_9NEOP
MATGKEGSNAVIHECQVKCSSREHSSDLTAALTKGSLSDEKVAAYLKWCCIRYSKAWDSDGRNLVHMAASVGRLKLLNYLLKHKDININEKDKESHYTALHRSLFYGQIHCAVRLIEQGANIQQLDLDDLTPLDHVLKDRPRLLEYNEDQPCEVYVWGTNTNYTLGTGHHQSRTNPEPLDMFRRQGISIKQVVMSKFHSAFISSDGRLWTCGHGQGGRLGLEDELTVLTPKSVKLPSNIECLQVDLGIDHTILLMANNSVLSFGLNSYHQLGHSPPPEKVLSPKPIKALKDVTIIGIKAAKYHSAFWSKEQLFTCGLNGGQLGHIKGADSTVSTPKVVNFRNWKDATIETVASSDGATVVANNKGEVYLLYEYQCKKIISRSRQIQPKKICVIGGHLDHNLKIGSLQEKGGDELKILIITNSNRIYLWQENTGDAFRCELSLRREIHISDIVLNKNFLLLTSRDGEAFQGEIKVKKRKALPDTEKQASRKSTNESPQRDEYDYIKLKRVPHIHRGVNVTSDLKGRNFAITQVHPKARLLQIPHVVSTEMKENMKNLFDTIGQYDPLHDVTFEVEGHRFSAHRYIVAHSSPVLEEMMKNAAKVNGSCVLKLDNIKAVIFRRILCFMYTRDCDLLQAGVCPVKIDLGVKENQIIQDLIPDIPDDLIDNEMISAFEYNNMKRANAAAKKKALKIKERENPLKLLKAAAKRFELSDLQTKLETVRYVDGYIFKTQEKSSFSDIKFERKNFDYLWDVSLKSEDGMIIKAHKCILVSRLEYFDCMINQGWLESTQKTAINLPIPGKILQILINYLYTDEAPDVVNSEDADLAAMTLIIADQFFCSRLKEFAEFALANLISLKNVAEIFQMAEMHNADQLKRCSMEFICFNLPAILESRSLEKLSDSTLEDLSDFYRRWLTVMDSRQITTYHNAPDDALVELINKTEPVSLDIAPDDTPTKPNSKTPKKKSREKRNSESGRTRNSSVGSITSEDEPEPLPVVDFCDDVDREEEAWVKVVNHPPKQAKNAAKVRVPVEGAKLISQPVPEEKYITLNKTPVKEEKENVLKENVQRLEKEFQLLSTNSERDFPALNSSPTERTYVQHPPSPRQTQEVFKKFVKISQKQRKRLAAQSISEDEETPKKPEAAVKSPWGLMKSESQLLIDIMKQESRANTTGQNSVLASSPPWQDTTKPGSSLSAVMASERRQRELIARMKSKPLEYTQMEDKAMEDLLMLYNANDITDERITVRRAEYEFLSPPVWVSSRK